MKYRSRIRFSPLILAAAVQAVTFAPGTIAQSEGEIEEINVVGNLSRYGATKSAVPILETARSISIESEDMFRDKGALSLDDILAYTSGVMGDTYGFSTRGDFPKVRGFDAAEYRDGQQVLFGFYNNSRSDVYMLEQVEVLKGPASVLYGKGTPGGIVNAISKLAGPDKDGEVVVEYGSDNRQQISGDINLELTNNLYFRMVGLYRDSDTQVDNVQDDAAIFMPSITYQNETTSVTLMAEVLDRDTDTAHQFLPLQASGCLSSDVKVSPDFLCAQPTQQQLDSSAYLGHPDFNRYNTDSTLVSLLANHEVTDQLSLEGVIRYKDADVDYFQTWIDFNGASPRVDADGNGQRTWYLSDASSEQLAVDLRMRYEFETGNLAHEVFAGVSYQEVITDNNLTYLRSVDSINIFNPVNGELPAAFASLQPGYDAPESRTEEHGIYLNDQISVGKWKVNLGLRYDDSKSGSAGSPKQGDYALSASAGVLYAFDMGLSPYISYAESFEPVVGNDGLTNQPLKPREGEQWEAGIKYQPQGSQTYITAAYFDIEETNLANPASLITEANSQQEGVGTSKGFELEVHTRVHEDISVEANLTIMDTESAEGVAFDSIPEKQFSAWVQYQPSEGDLLGFKAALGVRYAGENESNQFSTVAPGVVIHGQVVTEGATLFDAMVGYENQDWDLTLNLRNLTDEEYYGTCLVRGDCFPGETRSVVGKVVRKF
ncbi:TonB-dependent siderophore receptor [Pseudomaricurvus alkylphenolicus]|jgi:iron complex outermembrane receptor protein|uniref:TonB-dependent siderophore receptor n=1 Tax=Pseudomaricurvus alkylphenolicus TaxID=1306991 RepID=UPI0014200A0D|nr:TonB-dependent siderophore receptor [Pseudomaricurvus alkylphenolicus]NIB41743.1 TonB-dependent siderophore receptor [Pseudomaricurvus alkylphenolicus]